MINGPCSVIKTKLIVEERKRVIIVNVGSISSVIIPDGVVKTFKTCILVRVLCFLW